MSQQDQDPPLEKILIVHMGCNSQPDLSALLKQCQGSLFRYHFPEELPLFHNIRHLSPVGCDHIAEQSLIIPGILRHFSIARYVFSDRSRRQSVGNARHTPPGGGNGYN